MDARAVDDGLINLFDFEVAAAKCLPRMAWDYFASGAHDEVTLRENHAAYDRIGHRPDDHGPEHDVQRGDRRGRRRREQPALVSALHVSRPRGHAGPHSSGGG